jgi:hypothetical protein
MPSPATVIRQAAATAAVLGDRGSLLRRAVSLQDGRPDAASRDIALAAAGRRLRSVMAWTQVLMRPGATLPGRAPAPA